MAQLVKVVRLEERVRVTYARVKDDTLVAKGRRWVLTGVKPRRWGTWDAYLAIGPEVIPWPSQDVLWDVMDDGQRVRVTPEYLDRLVRDADTEAFMRGVRGISTADRLVHLGAGAAIGMVATVIMLKAIGYAGSIGV